MADRLLIVPIGSYYLLGTCTPDVLYGQLRRAPPAPLSIGVRHSQPSAWGPNPSVNEVVFLGRPWFARRKGSHGKGDLSPLDAGSQAAFDAGGGILVDAHVHFHPCFDACRFLDSAGENFQVGARRCNLPASTPGCLMFTESQRADYFHRFADGWAIGDGPWRMRPTAEEVAVAALRDGQPRMFLIAGRQIVTAEGIELLALGSLGLIPDGGSIRAVVRRVQEAAAIAVAPWGFGKWRGHRGAILRELIEVEGAGGFYLGDNGGRLRWSRPPRLFRMATAGGVLILPGSDPLPFRAQESYAGRYGSVLRGQVDLQHPLESIKRLLAQGGQPSFYGRREGLLNFVRYQVAMQMIKRRR